MKIGLRKAFSVMLAAGMAVTMLGAPVSAGWVQKGEDYYYENSDGSYKTGWIKTKSGDYYYCLKSGKRAQNCTVKIGGVSYKFDKNGKAVNKPESKEETSSKKNSSDNKKTTGKAVKNQNTFPGLVTYGVYCGMSEKDFKALKRFDEFKWDRNTESYIVDDMQVFIDNGMVSVVSRSCGCYYGYTDKYYGYFGSDDAERKVATWRKERLKTHKNKKVLKDNSTKSTLTDGEIFFYTNCDDIIYCITDVIWDTTYNKYYATESYIYYG